MAIHPYGVLKGMALSRRLARGNENHIQVFVIGDDKNYRVAINVKSQAYPSSLKYYIDEDFQHPITDKLEKLKHGFTKVWKFPNGLALDYIRGNLFDIRKMKVLAPNIPGPNNDLNEKIDKYLRRAIDSEDAMLYAFGESFGPERERDPYFNFRPAYGVHDVHMNQGNLKAWQHDDGIWQDGGLIIHYPSVDRWVGIFLAFQSQTIHTDDQTGHRVEKVSLGNLSTENDLHKGKVFIIAASVNPPGSDLGNEKIILLNVSDSPIDLEGWSILDDRKQKDFIRNTILQANNTIVIRLTGNGARLLNRGGLITLLDSEGLKVDGVSYTKKHAEKEGWLMRF